MEGSIQVTMFGKFTIRESGWAGQPGAISLTGRSRRLWTLVAYLILHRDRGVSAQELIDLLWQDTGGNNPQSTLQNNVSRARAALEGLGLADARQLICNDAGMYRWAPGRETVLDCEEFEKIAALSLAERDRDRGISMAQKAIALYTGEFLPESAMENWCIHINSYYRSLYLRLCRQAVHWLFDADRLAEVEDICTRVIRQDPAAEEFSISLMRAQIMQHNPEKALEHYDYIRQLFRDTYGVAPSEELEMMKSLAVQERYGSETEDAGILEFLFRSESEKGAFYCDSNVFREMAKLRLRDMKRTRVPSQLVIFRVKGDDFSMEKRTVYMRRLESTLQKSLRSVDPYTRLGDGRLLLMLTNATRENADKVLNRVQDCLRRDYPRAGFNYSARVIDLGELAAREDGSGK